MATVGIDFGTSNTGAAWLDSEGRARVAAVRDGVYLMPTVAWYGTGGHVLVGQAARQQLIDDPKNTVTGVKRFLGRRYDSPFVNRHKDRFAYQIVAGPDGMCAAKLGDRIVPLEDVAVDIFKRIIELAVVSHKKPFDDALVTVPAHYGFAQRNVIRRAASRAGIKVRGMVHEPTAAAMYYARKKGNDGTVLVFDLGGGTFDATLMAIMGGVVKVIATGGDAFLGGADFDAKIVDELVDEFQDANRVDIRGDAVAMQRLAVAAEAAKIELSKTQEVRIRVPCIATVNERFLDLETRLSRSKLENLCSPLIERCLGVCEAILKRAGLAALEVDEIVFVGGMTRMPALRVRLARIFAANPAKHVHPDLGVVVGAALLSDAEKGLIDVNSMAIGLMMPGGIAKELVPANTPVPSVQRTSVDRPPPGQPLVFGLYETADVASLERDVLGTVRVAADVIGASEGPLTVEAFLGDDLDIGLYLVTADGKKTPLDLSGKEQKEPQKAKPPPPAANDRLDDPSGPLRTLGHPGFRSVTIQPDTPASSAEQSAEQSSESAEDDVPEAALDDVEEVGAQKRPEVAIKRLPPQQAQEPVQKSRADSTGGDGPVDPDEPAPPQPGDTVGAYELIDVLGKGGMGRVYLAEHKRLRRRVALKMLRRRFARNKTAVERFLSEARAVNQISHENIIQVTDFFETDDGRNCTIMEVLDGRSLAGLLESVGAVAPDRAIRIAYQVAAAMAVVHDAHIVHRDLKPENIFLTQRGGRRDFVKLLDFGVAKLVDQEGNSLHDTGIGARIGTLDYMPPEQLMGQTIDVRADIFALGVVLYEMVTGRLPFSSGGTDRELLFQQISQPHIAPSKLPGVTIDIPPELDELILQCLESDAVRRPQTMREVAGRLEVIAERLLAKGPAPEDDTAREIAFFSAGLAGGAHISSVEPMEPIEPLAAPAAGAPSTPTPAHDVETFASVAVTTPDGPLRGEAPKPRPPPQRALAPEGTRKVRITDVVGERKIDLRPASEADRRVDEATLPPLHGVPNTAPYIRVRRTVNPWMIGGAAALALLIGFLLGRL